MTSSLTIWVPVQQTPRVPQSSLEHRTMSVSEATPITLTNLPLIGGTTTCTVRGRTTWCNVRRCGTLTDPVVLHRLALIDNSLVCIILVAQVFRPTSRLRRVVMNGATRSMALTLNRLGTLTAGKTSVRPNYNSSRRTSGAL